jgi:hypothetical protein
MQQALEDANADQLGDFGWLTTPGVKGLFKRTPRLLYNPSGGTVVNVTGDPIWSDDNEIDGLMARASNQVPKTLTKGTSSVLSRADRGRVQRPDQWIVGQRIRAGCGSVSPEEARPDRVDHVRPDRLGEPLSGSIRSGKGLPDFAKLSCVRYTRARAGPEIPQVLRIGTATKIL